MLYFHYLKKNHTNLSHPTLIFVMSNSLSYLKEAFSFSTVCTHSAWHVCLFICLFLSQRHVLSTYSKGCLQNLSGSSLNSHQIWDCFLLFQPNHLLSVLSYPLLMPGTEPVSGREAVWVPGPALLSLHDFEYAPSPFWAPGFLSWEWRVWPRALWDFLLTIGLYSYIWRLWFDQWSIWPLNSS